MRGPLPSHMGVFSCGSQTAGNTVRMVHRGIEQEEESERSRSANGTDEDPDSMQDVKQGSGASPRAASSEQLAKEEQRKVIERMLRVNHAGELGARQIYAGQLAVLGNSSVGGMIREMAQHELEHLQEFEKLVVERRVRPTVMLPLWNIAGFALGFGSALMGKEAAMACTVAVEDVISKHYNDQVRELLQPGWEHEQPLREKLRKFRDDEMDHHDIGIEHDAQKAPAYDFISNIIKQGCHAAIFVSERV
ncbi:5-demethoxyubiquinone hydroxylase, mitochondrial [Porphyridium purpureum]|uniref:5-demethoxyubiquinone hydroxylase, mitochondrial n=1 Tax=Porphyridium purpureum TaxID=35688 RepID=A0A5J4YUZ8_PORPP|nr:5-demethoxyubiquinone hydroxylase, mitochondrial [Porphyridium purpureum]|eukprot:POR5408..scf227_4